MTNLIIIGILVVIIGSAIVYIIKEKKKGAKCIGCPAGGNCPYKNSGQSKCNCATYSGTKES